VKESKKVGEGRDWSIKSLKRLKNRIQKFNKGHVGEEG